MSNFPFPWWDKTVTIYNKLIDPTTQHITWYKTTCENCFWKCTNTLFNMGRYGVSTLGVRIEDKEIVCRIPESEKFVDKRVWETLDETERENSFTLANGDIIVLGEVDDVIDEYTEGQRSTDLITKYKAYDECLEVSAYVNNCQTGSNLRHYRIIGK